MELKRSKQASVLLWAALLSQNLAISVMAAASSEDQKYFFPPYPHQGTPPTESNLQNLMTHGALSNTRTDGLGDLCREGTAALLNSVVHAKFPYTTSQVRNSFLAALASDKAAAAQAQLFKLANEAKSFRH